MLSFAPPRALLPARPARPSAAARRCTAPRRCVVPAGPTRGVPARLRASSGLDADAVDLTALGLPGQDAIGGVSAEDAQTLDAILSAGAWDDVQALVRSLAMEGTLQPGVLLAAKKVLSRASADASAPVEMVNSLTSVVELLTKTLEALEALRPKAELAEKLTELDPAVPSERAAMLSLMQAAFAKDVNQIDFIEDMVFFVKSADQQDAEFLAAVVDGRIQLGEHKLEDVMAVRRQGRERMSTIVDLASGLQH